MYGNLDRIGCDVIVNPQTGKQNTIWLNVFSGRPTTRRFGCHAWRDEWLRAFYGAREPIALEPIPRIEVGVEPEDPVQFLLDDEQSLLDTDSVRTESDHS